MQQAPEPACAFSEYLIGMPICSFHNICYGRDVLHRYIVVEEITHGVDEDHAGFGPSQWFGQFLGDQPQIKSLLVGMSGYAAKPFRKRLRVAMLAAWTNLGATADRVPCCVRPLDFGAFSHVF